MDFIGNLYRKKIDKNGTFNIFFSYYTMENICKNKSEFMQLQNNNTPGY